MSPYDFSWEDVKQCLRTLDRETEDQREDAIPVELGKLCCVYRSKADSKGSCSSGHLWATVRQLVPDVIPPSVNLASLT